MTKLLLKIILLGFVVTSILGGCGQEQKKDTVEVLARGPDPETFGIVPDYASRAIEAAGGPDAWMKTKELQLDCVVTFYRADGSYYLTEQHYDVYPWSNAILISGREPQGKFVWKFSRGQFSSLQGSDRIEALPSALDGRCFAEVILNVLTIPARFFDQSVEFGRLLDPVKVRGQWYYPVDRRMKPRSLRDDQAQIAEPTALEAVEDLSEAVFYLNRDSSLFDMLWFSQMSPGWSLMVRGYDYSRIEKEGVLVPARIEIFKTEGLFGGGGAADSQERLVKIDCHTLRRAK